MLMLGSNHDQDYAAPSTSLDHPLGAQARTHSEQPNDWSRERPMTSRNLAALGAAFCSSSNDTFGTFGLCSDPALLAAISLSVRLAERGPSNQKDMHGVWKDAGPAIVGGAPTQWDHPHIVLESAREAMQRTNSPVLVRKPGADRSIHEMVLDGA